MVLHPDSEQTCSIRPLLLHQPLARMNQWAGILLESGQEDIQLCLGEHPGHFLDSGVTLTPLGSDCPQPCVPVGTLGTWGLYLHLRDRMSPPAL